MHGDALSPRERAVAAFLLENREEAAFLPALAIAERLGTSDATVVRTVKALGYGGLGQLRSELIDELRARATPAARLERSFEQLGSEPASVLDHVVSLQVEFLEEMRRTIRPEEFARAVETLAAAGRTVVAGIGPTGALVEYLSLRLRRIGRASTTLTATGLRLADELIGVRADDAVVLVVYEHLDPDTSAMLARANEVGAPVVLVTDTLGTALADRVEVALAAPRSRAGALSTVTTTVALFDGLLLALAGRDRAGALAGLDELTRLRELATGRAVRPDRDWHDVGLLGSDES